MKHVDLLGLQLEPTSQAPLVLLREQDEPHRVLPVFVGPAEATAIALALSDTAPPRPLTHDLMVTLLSSLEATVERVEITEVRDEAFVAELVMRASDGLQRIDARPSDAIALALRVDAPLLVSDEVLDESGVTIEIEPLDELDEIDETVIEAEVDQFRAFLDDIDPDDFAAEHDADETTAVDELDPDADQPAGDEHPDTTAP